MGTYPKHICSCMQSVIHFWLLLEKVIMKTFLWKFVKTTIRELYLLDKVNKDLVVVNNDDFYIKSANKGLLGACESYMSGSVSLKNIDVVVSNVISSGKYWTNPSVRYKNYLDCLNFEAFSTP